MSALGLHASLPFLLAVLFLLFSYQLRAIRLTAIFPEQYDIWPFHLLFSHAIGNAISSVTLPLLGDLYRVHYIHRICKVRMPYAAAAIVFERLSDLIILLFLLFALFPRVSGRAFIDPHIHIVLIVTTALVVAGLFLFGVMVSRFQKFRYVVWDTSSFFNETIKYGILDLCWSFSLLISHGTLGKARYVVTTLLLWVSNVLSLWCLLWSLHVFGVDLRPDRICLGLASLPPASAIWSIMAVRGALFLTPLLFVFLYIGLRSKSRLLPVLTRGIRDGYKSFGENVHPISERYKQYSEYELFLASVFSDGDNILSGFGISGLEDGVVHKLFTGGSGAVTAQVEAEGQLRIRKFAVGNQKEKLKNQAEWLELHGSELPLVGVMEKRTAPTFFRYDMKYSPAARDFYDIIHMESVDSSFAFLENIFGALSSFHDLHRTRDASDKEVDDYLIEKAAANASKILSFVSGQIDSSEYTINGKSLSLDDWRILTDMDWLRSQIRNPSMSVIHGDMTIENIIIDPTHSGGFYLIDPNPGNVFDTPFIDWAKLLQSLNLGYENLNKYGEVRSNGRELLLPFTKSYKYSELHERYKNLLLQRFGPEQYREIKFHELVNYLRLVPYKIRQNAAKGTTFFACTSVLLDRYLHGDPNAA